MDTRKCKRCKELKPNNTPNYGSGAWLCKECKESKTKPCTKCEAEFPIDFFYGTHGWCKNCEKKRRSRYYKDNRETLITYAKDWYVTNKDVRRDSLLKREYGITLEEYNRMLTAQNGKCAICKQSDASKKALAVDHCHKSGKVRGLLCGSCNVKLGWFENKEDAVVTYLHQSRLDAVL